MSASDPIREGRTPGPPPPESDTGNDRVDQAVAGGGGCWPAASFWCRARASWDFLRDARLGWMTRLAAALSSFLAARLYSSRSLSRGPSRAALKRLSCVLRAFLVA